MRLRKWDDLPEKMKVEGIRKYYDTLHRKRVSLLLKRIFDVIVSIIILLILLPVFFVLSIAIKVDSKGPVLYCQQRITRYGKQFEILKFRTMVVNAEKIGAQVTTRNDMRVTRLGRILRKWRLDEIPQLLNIISGDMTFVGTRPEVMKYVEQYSDEMMATLLLPAGVTSEASIQYMDEEKILDCTENSDNTYLNEILPEKMEYNLKSIENFSFLRELWTIIRTPLAIINWDEDNLREVTMEKEDYLFDEESI